SAFSTPPRLPLLPLLPYSTLFRSVRGRLALSLSVRGVGAGARLGQQAAQHPHGPPPAAAEAGRRRHPGGAGRQRPHLGPRQPPQDRKSTRLNSSYVKISYAVFCLE